MPGHIQTLVFEDGETWTYYVDDPIPGVSAHLVKPEVPNSDGVDYADTSGTTDWTPPPEMCGDGWNGVY